MAQYGQPVGGQYGSNSPTTGYAPQPGYGDAGQPVVGQEKMVYMPEGQPLFDDPNVNEDLKKNFVTNGCRDWGCAVLFLIQFAACIIVGIINMSNGSLNLTVNNTKSSSSSGSSTTVNVDSSNTAKTFARAAGAALGISIVITAIFLLLIRQFATTFIWMSVIFVILCWLAVIIVGFAIKATALAVIGIIFLLLNILWVACVRHTFPLSSFLLKRSSDAVFRYPSTVLGSFLILAVGIVWYIFFFAMAIPTLNKLENSDNAESTSNGAAWLCIVFLFLFYWNCSMFFNIVHAGTAGLVGTIFFCGENEAQMPSNPTLASYKRASTTSFGSLAALAAIVALIKTLRALARAMYERNRGNILACLLLCFMNCLEYLVKLFNDYAVSLIAITGMDFMSASKTALEFIGTSFFAVIVNDIIVDRVLFLVSLLSAAMVSVICYFAFDKSWIAAVAGILVSIVVSIKVFRTVDSGVVTLLVCCAFWPEIWRARHPTHADEFDRAIAEFQRGCCGGSDEGQQQA